MKKLWFLIALVCLASNCYGQASPPSTYTPQLISFTGAPFGVCDIYQFAINNSNGNYYTCNISTRQWVGVGAVATGTVNPGTCTDGQLFYNTTSASLQVCHPANTFVSVGGSNGLPNTPLAFSATPVFPVAVGVSYSMTLTGDITSSTTSGSPANGYLMSLSLKQDGTGGHAINLPANFVLPTGFSFDTTANHTNALTFKYDGTNWNLISNSGGTATNPGSPFNSFQKNCAGSFCGGSATETGGVLTVPETLTISGSNPLNVGGTATFSGDTHHTGPNPYFDIMNYGGYIQPTSSANTMSCSITVSTTTLNCAANPDFANGNGVVVALAGLTPTGRNGSFPSAPTVGTVTPVGVTNGSTTYGYKVVLEDYFGGLTAAGTAGSTVVGAATLGTNTVSLTGVVRSSGIDTFTCSTNCNVSVGSQVSITGFTGGTSSLVNGTGVVNTIPTATTFTILATGFPDYTESASATLSVKACNDVFPSGTLSQESVILRSWIYRQTAGAGNYNLVGVAPGQDPYYRDCGQGASGPAYVPSTAPASAQAGYLVSKITAGGGTTSLTLNDAAGTSASSQTTQHDNSVALKAAISAAFTAHGGNVRLPVITPNTNATIPFNATTDLTTVTNSNNATAKISLAAVTFNQPFIPANGVEVEGMAQASTSFNYLGIATWIGAAQPMILINHNTVGGVRIARIKFVLTAAGQSSIVSDENITGGGEVGLILDDNGYLGNTNPAVIIKGGFDFWITRGFCSVAGEAGGWAAHPCIELTNASSYLGTQTQVPGRVYIDHTNFSGGISVQVDNLPQGTGGGVNTSGGGNIFMQSTLHESYGGAALRIVMGSALAAGFNLFDATEADTVTGSRTPLVEATGNSQAYNINMQKNNGASGGPTVLSSTVGSSANNFYHATTCIGNVTMVGCGALPNTTINGDTLQADGGIISTLDSGSMGYLMSTPAAPASCVVSGGGSVPTGTVTYAIAAVDRTSISFTPLAGITLIGPTCSATTTGGNQTVTVTRPTLPAGAAGWLVWRAIGGGAALAQIPTSCSTPIPATTTTFVDTSATTCGQSAPPFNTALANGVFSDRVRGLRVQGGGVAGAVLSTCKTANYTVTDTDFDVCADPTGGAFTITLPHATTGYQWTVTNVSSGANLVTVQPDSGSIVTPSGISTGSVTLASGVSSTFDCNVTNNCVLKSSNSSSSSSVTNASQYAIAYYSAPGSANTINGFGPSTNAGIYLPLWNNPTAAATTPTIGQLGSFVNSQACTTYTLVASDRAAWVRCSGGSTATITLPQAVAPFNSNFPFAATNLNSGNLTITANAANTINGGGAGGSITVLPGWRVYFSQDNAVNWFADQYPTFTAFPSCLDTAGQHLNFSSSLGFICGTSGGGSAAAGGSPTQWQYNNTGNLAGMAESAYNSTNGTYTWTQKANGNDMGIYQRFTNSTPTGNYFRFNDSAATLIGNLDVNLNWFATSFGVGTSGARTTYTDTTGFRTKNTGLVDWSSTSNAEGSVDTGLSRDGAGLVDVGNGTQGDASGGLIAFQHSNSVANNGSTATVLNKLAILAAGSPQTATVSTTGTTTKILGVVIAGAGTTGSAKIAYAGQAQCIFDGATTAGDYVQNSGTTGGDCHDAGSTKPSSGDILGYVMTTNGAGGTYNVFLAMDTDEGYLNAVTAASAAGAAKQICTSSGASRTCTYIDFPETFYIPSANCVNATAASAWSTAATPAALCRAGTNNKDGLLSPWGASDVGYFRIHLPNDWDSGASLDITLDLTSTDATNGHTIIMQASTICGKGDGSTTDDVAFNAAQAFGTITLNGNANRTWNATLTGLTKTGCTAGSTLWVKISRTTDTATNVGVYGATVDVARLLTVQAN